MDIIQFIYFDVGNVFLRFEHMWERVIHVIGELSPDAVRIKDQLVTQLIKGKINYMEYWDALGKGKEIRKHFPNYEDYLVSGFIPIEEMHLFAHELEQKGKYHIGLLTDVAHNIHELNAAKGKVPSLNYTTIIKSCDVGCQKPEKEIFRIAQSAAGCLPQQILFVDDMEANVRQAKELGWNALKCDPTSIDDTIQEIRQILSR